MSQPTRRLFYGWWIVLAGSMAMAMFSGLFTNGFGFFFEPIRQYFGWSRTVLSGAYALSRVESSLFGPFIGFLIHRFGPRAVMTAAFVAFGLGFLLLSRAGSILTFYLAFLVLATGADPPGFIAIVATINNWFRVYRARAIGFAMLGMGLGGVIFPPILAYGFDNFSWKTVSLASGVFVLTAGVLVSRVLRFNPEPYGYLPDGVRTGIIERPTSASHRAASQRPPRRDSPTEYDFGINEALKTRAFWAISIGHAQALLVISAIGLHQVPYLETDLGLPRASAAQVVMVLTAVNMLGQITGGFLGDRLPKNYLAAATMVGHSVALLVLATADRYSIAMVSAVIQGLAWGIRTPVLTSMRGDYFGRKSFALIMGSSQGVAMLGMIVGPLLVGYLADHFSYSLGFKVVAACTAPGSLLFVFLRNPRASLKSDATPPHPSGSR